MALVTTFLAPIRFYQRFISPGLPRRCKYEPTCSAYAVSAVRELGVVRGSVVAAWRVLRCNPWSHGGWDPVSERKLFPTHDCADGAHAEQVESST
ncbi:MAG: membrane protein insertion efficiency factor YidD [Actinomycetota bacterium]|nr:membrane protein insertion efficiency factor YidD [Actinomycetota bacterium]